MDSKFNDVSILEYFKILEDEFEIFRSLYNRTDEMMPFLDDLFLKEEKMIEKFPYNIAFLEDFSISVHSFYDNDDSVKKYFVLSRFDNTLEVLKANIERETVSEEILNDEFYDGYSVFNQLRESIIRNFIYCVPPKFGYLAAFSIREISDDLILNNLDLYKIELSDFDEEQYSDFLAEEVQQKIVDLITLSEFEQNVFLKKYNILIFKFMLSKLCNYDFDLIFGDFKNDVMYLNNNSYFDILNIFKQENKKRNKKEIVGHVVDMNTFDSLVNLIKLEEVLFQKYCSLDVNNLSTMNSIFNLIEYEKEMVDDLKIDKLDCDILYDVISSDIDFFLTLDYSQYIRRLISNRIINLISVFRDNVVSDTFGKCYSEIMKNHIINSLNEYKSIICDVASEDDVFNYIQVYKNVIFEYPELLDDVIALDYNFSSLFKFDDEVNSLILGFKDSINYFYDKDNQLYLLVKKIIREISDILVEMDDNSELVSLYEFKICEFNDIINSVSTEHLYSLYNEIDEISNSDVRNILLRKVNVVHKY